MVTRRASFILPLVMSLALMACGSDSTGPAPLDAAALSAVIEKPGVDRERLARAVDALFTEPGAKETRAVVVLRDGRIIAERYAPEYGRGTRFIGWSMTKCVTGLLVGLLVSDGRLRLDEPAPIPAWQRPGDPRGEITLRHLLQMRSGLRHSEHADLPYKADTVRLLFLDGRDDAAAYAEAQPLSAEPGTTFQYSTATSVILADLAARTLAEGRDAAGKRQVVGEYLRTRLFDPAGMRSMQPEFDPAGTFIGGSMLHGTARDWAKLGEFLRNKGSVRGAQVVPRSWIEFMTSPSPANRGYGAQLWLNRPQPTGRAEVLFPGRAPSSLFACIGHQGQYVLVSREQRLTVVRLGKTDDGERDRLVDNLGNLVSLFPVQRR